MLAEVVALAGVESPVAGVHANVAPAPLVAAKRLKVAPEQTVVSLLAVSVRLSANGIVTVLLNEFPHATSLTVTVLGPLVNPVKTLDV